MIYRRKVNVFLRCPISEVAERHVHGSPKRYPFSCCFKHS